MLNKKIEVTYRPQDNVIASVSVKDSTEAQIFTSTTDTIRLDVNQEAQMIAVFQSFGYAESELRKITTAMDAYRAQLNDSPE